MPKRLKVHCASNMTGAGDKGKFKLDDRVLWKVLI